MGQLGLEWSSVIARSHDDADATGGRAKLRERGGAMELVRSCSWSASSKDSWCDGRLY